MGKDVETILDKWKTIKNAFKLGDEIQKDLIKILSNDYAIQELRTASENFTKAREENEKVMKTSTVEKDKYRAKENLSKAEKLLENVKKRSKEAVARGIVLKIGQPPTNVYTQDVGIIARFLEKAIVNPNKSDLN